MGEGNVQIFIFFHRAFLAIHPASRKGVFIFFMVEKENYMRQAIELSKYGLGTTSPNPNVGCIIVRDDRVVGRGYHAFAGGPHAEVVALKEAGDLARGAEVYVTLEPCSHYGKTPPCADALIEAGVKKVYISCIDPNPVVSGNGVKKLKEAGIEVETGVLFKEAYYNVRYYHRSIEKGLPYITVKMAMTLDGFIADKEGKSKWISGEEARKDVQELRRIHDAVMVGAGTFITDRPRLTYRGEKKKNPPLKRFVICSKTETVQKVLEIAGYEDFYIFIPAEKSPFNDERIIPAGNQSSYLKSVFEYLNSLNIRSVLVEGGAGLAGSLIEEKLVDELVLFVSPKILGGGIKLFKLKNQLALDEANSDFCVDEVYKIGSDVFIRLLNREMNFLCSQE